MSDVLGTVRGVTVTTHGRGMGRGLAVSIAVSGGLVEGFDASGLRGLAALILRAADRLDGGPERAAKKCATPGCLETTRTLWCAGCVAAQEAR